MRLIPRRRRRTDRRHDCPQIDPSLARVLAGQVAAGLAHGRGASPRAALTAIGVMLANATDDPHAHATLDAADRLTIEPCDGGVEISYDAGEPRCTRPPEGWACTREADHDGPCAAVPDPVVAAP